MSSTLKMELDSNVIMIPGPTLPAQVAQLKLRSVEDISNFFHFFAQRNEPPPCGYVKCITPPHVYGEPFRPYDVVILKRNADSADERALLARPLRHIVVTPTHVAFVREDGRPEEVMSLAHYLWSSRAFDQLCQIRFFKTFILKKMLLRWRSNISRLRFSQAREALSKVFFLSKVTFAKPTAVARQWAFGFALTQREGEANPARILDIFSSSSSSNSNNMGNVDGHHHHQDNLNINTTNLAGGSSGSGGAGGAASSRNRRNINNSNSSNNINLNSSTTSGGDHGGSVVVSTFDPNIAFESTTLMGGSNFPPRLFFFANTRPLSGIPPTQFLAEQHQHLASIMQLFKRIHSEVVQVARVVVNRVTADAEMPDVNTYEELEQYLGLQSGVPTESLGPIAQIQRNLERQGRKRELKRRLVEYDFLPTWLRLLDQMVHTECFSLLRRSVHFIANHLGLPANGLIRECRHNMHIELVLDVEKPTTFTPNCEEITATYAAMIDETIRQISNLPRITELEEFRSVMFRPYENRKLKANINDDDPVALHRGTLIRNINHDMLDAEDKGKAFDVCRVTLIWLEVDWIAMRDDWSRRLEGPGGSSNIKQGGFTGHHQQQQLQSPSLASSPGGTFKVGDGAPSTPNLPTEGELKQCLSRVSKARGELSKLVSRPIGIVTIHIEPTLQKLNAALDSVVADVRSILLSLCSKRITDITNDIEGNLLTLRAPGLELRHFAEWVERCQKVQASQRALLSHCEGLERLFNIADDYFFEVPSTLAEKRERLIGAGKGGFPPLRQQFMDAIGKAASHMENNVNAVKNQLSNEIQNTTALIESLKNNLTSGECRKSGHVATVMVQKLEGINHTLKTAAITRQTLDHYCKLLEVELPEWEVLGQAQQAYQRRIDVWSTKAKWDERKQFWQKTPVGQLNGEQLKEQMIELFQRAHRMNRLDGDTATDDLLNDLSAEKVNLPVIVELCNPALTEEHWYKISEGIGKKLPPPEARTLDSLKTLGAYAHFDVISEISAVATGEWSVANQVKKVADAWEETAFILAKPKQSSQKPGQEELFILGGLDEVFQQIDEHQVQVQTCMASRYVDGVRRQVEEWDTKLKLFYDCIQEWVAVQRSWLYLEFIFSSDDIKKQLPDESRLFATVDKTFRTLMSQTVQNNNVQAICTQPGLLDLLKQATYNLERIQKHLEEYLETKRVAFPRFYFLSNDELLSILSDVRNATAVQPHLQKCFDSIKSLQFESDNVTVKAMVSPEGEVVPFSSKVRAVGNAETWLGEIEKMMRQTLYDQTREAREVYPDRVREEWIFQYPSQCIQCVDQIVWTRETEQVWKEIDDASLPGEVRDNHPLVRYRDRYKQQIMRLVGLVKTSLSTLNRTCTCTLIVLGVHNRDVLSSLVDNRVTSGGDFEWSKQMRYYWIEKGGMDDNSSIASPIPQCYIHHADAKIVYGYEYLGNALRLVITPLTERAFMTCTGALRLCQGAAPQGPAGTGKTESVKDLGKALARQVVVFNCSDGINYKIMSRMFAGLAQAGAWACFDEFNRIPIEVLSVVAQQMLEITTAVQLKLDTIFFDGAHNIKLNRNFGVFITMNPGYAGRTELPDNLKALFRPICMMIPDYALIAEIMFFSEGFGEARSLAQKMVRLYSLASQQLSKQDHYDFGMRAVKSILVVAGALKRAAADDVPEDVTLIRAMREANIPKFLRDDTKLFLALIKDLFPSVAIAEVENELLIKGISHAMVTQKLQPVPTFITKVVQLFETMLVRHGVMLVGQTLTGKTACEESLTGALTLLHNKKENARANYNQATNSARSTIGEKDSKRGKPSRRKSVIVVAGAPGATLRRHSTAAAGADQQLQQQQQQQQLEEGIGGDDENLLAADDLMSKSVNSNAVDQVLTAPVSGRSNRSNRSTAATAEELIKDHDHIDDELFELVPDSHQRFYQPTHIVRVNPKSISLGELYGDVNPLTREWHDGILSHIVRELVKNTSQDRHWVLFDGPVDAVWIENMNTVLDDNKLLCLVNGERIKVPDTITTTFEVQDLKVASPATVSRCGMVFMEGYYLEGGWKPIAKSLCEKYADEEKVRKELKQQQQQGKEKDKAQQQGQQQPSPGFPAGSPASSPAEVLAQKERENLIPKPSWHADWAMETIGKLVPATITFIREQCKELIPSVDAQLVQAMIHLLHALHVSHINEMQSRKATLTALEWRSMMEEEDGDRVETSDPLKAKVPLSVSGYDERRTFNMLSVFAYFWSFGANLAESSRAAFSSFARDLVTRSMYVNLPSDGDIMNYFVHRGSMSWVPWSYRTPKFVYDPNKSYYDAFVPTPETVRLHSVIATLCLNNRNVLVSGVTGTGKSTGIRTVLFERLNTEDVHSKHQSFSMTFSAQTTSEDVQETLENKLQRRRGDKEMGPPPGKTMIFVVDDCNMPALETYGASPPIELLRQLISQGGAYNRKKLFFREFVDCLFVASCGEPGGSRSELTQRFTSRFHCISVPSLGNDSMMVIFKSILTGHFVTGKFNGDVASLAESLVNATIAIYRQIIKDMLPTPEKSHYTFNLRDVSKVVQGLVQVPSQHLATPEEAIILWVHEATRVFADRLTNEEDLKWWDQAVTDVAKKVFPASHVGSLLEKPAMTCSEHPSRVQSPTGEKQPKASSSSRPTSPPPKGDNSNDDEKENNSSSSTPASAAPPGGWATPTLGESNAVVIPCNGYLFGSWANRKHAEYVRITDADAMQHMLEEHQHDFKAQFMREEDLVLFKDATMHVARMCRILRLPRGNMLLVGVGGSGRRSLCSLASHIMVMDLKTISIFRNYGPNDFREDVKKILLEAGCQQRPVVFQLADSQLVHNAFLNDLNSLLNIGEVPGLMGTEELDRIMVACRDQVRAEGKPETRAVLYQCFVNRCQENMHIVLCMSPVGAAFRDNVRKFPSLVNCMSIDWFFPWPEEALKSVADRVLVKLKLAKHEEHLRDPVATLAVNMHTSVKTASDRMYEKLRRRNDTTPTSYLTLLSLISETLADQVTQNESNVSRYKLGLDKLSEVSKDVDVLQQRIKDAQPALAQAAKDVEEKTQIIAGEKEQADRVREEVADEEQKARALMQDAEQLKNQCEANLSEAMPVLEAAVKALEILSKKDIDEIRTFLKPPRLVEKTLNAVLVLLREDEGWSVAKSVLQRGDFLNRLLTYNKEDIPERVIRKLKPYIQDEEFVPEKIELVSVPCKSMCLWAHAIYKFYFVYRDVLPLKEKLAIAEDKVAAARAILEEKQSLLRDVERKVALLEEQLRETAAKQAQLEAQIAEAEKKLQRADALIVGMRDEKKRWISSLEDLENERGTLVGFSALAASAIAYLGAFTAEFRASLIGTWVGLCKDLEIPMREKRFTPSEIADAHTARSWTSLGLPSDDFSIENAVILTRSKRAGLLVDPEGQGGSFVKNLEKKNKIKIVKASDDSYMRVIESAVQVGVPVLLENCSEELDAALNPVLLRQTVRVGGRNVLRLGDKEVDFDPRFKLYLTTKLSNPVFSPELQVKVTVINFSVTRKGLEDQLLADVVATERKELQEKSDQCVVAIAEGKDNIRKLELQILRMLAEATGDILDNIELISTLQQSKRTADSIGRDLAAVEKANVEITAAREEYRVLAVEGSLIYRAISDLAALDAMYQNSLQFFKQLFLSVIERVQLVPGDSVADRVKRLLPAVTRTSFAVVCRGLFEKDKAIFAFILAVGIMKHYGKIHDSEMLVFLRGAAGKAAPMGFPLVPDFLHANPKVWNEFAAVATAVPAIDECTMKIRTDEDKKWSDWMMSDDVLNLPAGVARSKLTPWHQLLLAHALRPETTTRFMSKVVERELGDTFTSSPAFSLRDVYDDSSATTPLVFILSEGSDPTKLFQTFAEEMGFADKKLMLSLGQDQGGRAESYIEQGKNEGLWVYLQNCHVYTSWMPTLERLVENLRGSSSSSSSSSSAGGGAGGSSAVDGGGGGTGSGGSQQNHLHQVHPHFRLWLSSKPTSDFPVLVLQSGMKITREPPTGIRGKLKDTLVSGLGDAEWSAFTYRPPQVAAGQKPPPPRPIRDQAFDVAREFVWKRLVFALMFAHASILERRKYGPIGWNIPYQWGTPDLAAALKVIRVGMEGIPRELFDTTSASSRHAGTAADEAHIDMTDKEAVAAVVEKLAGDAKRLICDHLNWPAMDFTCVDLHFGGRVTDFLDQRCLGTVLRRFFGREILAEGFTFDAGAGTFIFPSDSENGSWRPAKMAETLLQSVASSPKPQASLEATSPMQNQQQHQVRQTELVAHAPLENTISNGDGGKKAAASSPSPPPSSSSPLPLDLPSHHNAAVTSSGSRVFRSRADFSFVEKITAPSMDETLAFIDDLPSATSPNILGLHANAAITFWMKECNEATSQLVSIQPREGAGEGKSVKDIVLEVAAEILKGLPEPISKAKAHSTTFATLADDTVNSLGTFLGQEIDQYNFLRNLIKSTLTTVIRAIKGEVLMNEAAEKVFDALAFNRVPEVWRSKGYLTLKPLASYVKDFHERFAFMRRWCQLGPPPSFWLSGMFFPQGFVTAVLQAHSRKFTMAIDSIILRFHALKEAEQKSPASVGVFIHGLFLEGAGWDSENQCICEPKPRQTTTGLPTIHFEPYSLALEKAKTAAPAAAYANDGSSSKGNSKKESVARVAASVVALRPSAIVPSYSCPLYKAGSRTGVLSTTGVSTNYVLNLELPLPMSDNSSAVTSNNSLSSTPSDEKHWILRGAAALCALDD